MKARKEKNYERRVTAKLYRLDKRRRDAHDRSFPYWDAYLRCLDGIYKARYNDLCFPDLSAK